MINIKNLKASIETDDDESIEILKGLNLEIPAGEVHAIMGPNGAGKSTLSYVLAGRDDYEVTNGSVTLDGEDLLEMEPEERAAAGLFLAFQYPIEIPGVNMSTFLKTSINAIRKQRGEKELDALGLLKLIKSKTAALGIKDDMMKRAVNVGFSGGEKKRNEVLQMAMLEPKFCVLDETDSGLDIDALKIVADGVNALRSPERSFLVITHYQRLLDYIKPDVVHVLADGKIVKSGGPELALELEEKGYAEFIGEGRMIDVQNIPTPKVEEWKYTNLSRGLGALKDIAPEAPREILIHKKRGEICKQPEDIVWIGVDGVHHQPKLKIELEEGAQATIVEFHEGEGAYWKNMSTEIILGPNSRLNHVRIVEDSLDSVQTNMMHIQMEQDSYLNSFSLNLGAKMSRHDIHAVLNGSNIDCSLNGINLLSGQQHGDTTIVMEHTAPHCVSNQFYRTILDDAARGVFQGKVHVHQAAQKTDGYQLANTILLSPKCEMDTKPELEIYADDVKCSHGTTTGALDEEPLFYLRSRGLSEAQARMLLMKAFVDEVADKIQNEALRTEIIEKSENWLDRQLS